MSASATARLSKEQQEVLTMQKQMVENYEVPDPVKAPKDYEKYVLTYMGSISKSYYEKSELLSVVAALKPSVGSLLLASHQPSILDLTTKLKVQNPTTRQARTKTVDGEKLTVAAVDGTTSKSIREGGGMLTADFRGSYFSCGLVPDAGYDDYDVKIKANTRMADACYKDVMSLLRLGIFFKGYQPDWLLIRAKKEAKESFDRWLLQVDSKNATSKMRHDGKAVPWSAPPGPMSYILDTVPCFLDKARGIKTIAIDNVSIIDDALMAAIDAKIKAVASAKKKETEASAPKK